MLAILATTVTGFTFRSESRETEEGDDPMDVTQASKADVIRVINRLREKETKNSKDGPVPDVVWDEDLASIAKDHLAGYCQKKPSDGDLDAQYAKLGGTGTVGEIRENLMRHNRLVEAVRLWAEEGNNYHYGDNECYGNSCINYIQIMSRKMTKMGCAKIMCDTKFVDIKCLFSARVDSIERPF